MKIEIETKIVVLGMKDGFITELSVEKEPDRIFRFVETKKDAGEQPLQPLKKLHLKPLEEDSQPKTVDTAEVTGLRIYPDKGKVIARLGASLIHENILKTIEEAKEKGYSTKKLKNIIAIYRPKCKESTHKAYVSVYDRYLGDYKRLPRTTIEKNRGRIIDYQGNTTIRKDILEEIDNTDKSKYAIKKVIAEKLPHVVKSTVQKYANEYWNYIQKKQEEGVTIQNIINEETKDPKEVYAFNKIYRRNITFGEYMKVRRLINKWNFVATTKNIQKETGISRHAIRAILNHMLKEEKIIIKIYKQLKNGDFDYVYYPVQN